MTNPDELLEHARRSFRQAAEMSDPASMRTYAEIGLTYLAMAHEDAAVFDASLEPDSPRCAGDHRE
ncbi:MAG TPA: hypothetical protein VHA55_07695 [Pseudorhodoplanes sp.]|jgi:hypothetical protein|nr:hypothetical protein [Pseudorhodoplanes sp.]